jgi:shikimate kinase
MSTLIDLSRPGAILNTLQRHVETIDTPHILSQLQQLPPSARQPVSFRLFKLEELGEDKVSGYRLAMNNVLATLNGGDYGSLVYILSCREHRVSIYLGVASSSNAMVRQGATILQRAFCSNLRGAVVSELRDDHPELAQLKQAVADSSRLGLVYGVPSLNDPTQPQGTGDEDFQSIERLTDSLLDETWQLVIVADPAPQAAIQDVLHQLYDYASDLSELHKRSEQIGIGTNAQQSRTLGTNSGTSTGTSHTDGTGTSEGASTTRTEGRSTSTTRGTSTTRSSGETVGSNSSRGGSDSTTSGHSSSTTSGTSTTRSSGETVGSNSSRGSSSSTNSGYSTSTSGNASTTRGKGESGGTSNTWGRAESSSRSENQGYSTNTSSTSGEGWSKTYNQGCTQGENWSSGTSRSTNTGESSGRNESRSRSENQGRTQGENWSSGTSRSTNTGESSSRNEGSTDSTNWGNSSTTNTGTNASHSDTRSETTNEGTSDSTTTAAGSNTSRSVTRERVDKRLAELLKHIGESTIERFQIGLGKGMFRSAIYLAAPSNGAYDRLVQGVRSLFQGNRPSTMPLQVRKLGDGGVELGQLLRVRQIPEALPAPLQALDQSVPLDEFHRPSVGIWLNTPELGLLAGLPARELPGLRLRRSVDFALNPPAPARPADSLRLGHMLHHGCELPLALSRADLNKHVFITGVTGAGKTTTCFQLLLASGLPFLVIEPAKTEYRALYEHDDAVEYYVLGREDLGTFRFNPFELVRGESLSSHINVLCGTLQAVFPMEAAMPYIVEEAIIAAYKLRGWDIHSGENDLHDDPWTADAQAWPIFSDVIDQLKPIIKSKGLGQEFEQKYHGSLVARLTNLTAGVKGCILNARRSLSFDKLLDRKVVIELDEFKDEQDKALFMGLFLGRVAECLKQRHRQDPGFRHLTLVEEAHRLLSRPEPGDGGARRSGVEMFANLLAEVRKYGEGLIIADQIPNKLIPDVIKNTNTKIVHRLFAADDRRAMADAMALTDEQRDFLPALQPGDAVVYCGGWHGAVRVQVDRLADTSRPEISEALIAQRNVQQLWDHRHDLLPNLARHSAVSDPQRLSMALRHAAALAQRLIAVVASISARFDSSLNAEEKAALARHRQVFSKRYVQWAQDWPDPVGELPSLLAACWRDCVTSVSLDEVADDQFFGQLGDMLQALGDSETAFLDHLQRLKTVRAHHFISAFKNSGS